MLACMLSPLYAGELSTRRTPSTQQDQPVDEPAARSVVDAPVDGECHGWNWAPEPLHVPDPMRRRTFQRRR